jgi:hypothetical protein
MASIGGSQLKRTAFALFVTCLSTTATAQRSSADAVAQRYGLAFVAHNICPGFQMDHQSIGRYLGSNGIGSDDLKEDAAFYRKAAQSGMVVMNRIKKQGHAERKASCEYLITLYGPNGTDVPLLKLRP